MRLLKLVRDKIPEIFADVGVVYEPLIQDELVEELRKKLIEEAYEYRDDPSIDELADVYEVLLALCDHDLECSLDEVVEVAHRKVEARGGFNNGIGMYLKKRS